MLKKDETKYRMFQDLQDHNEARKRNKKKMELQKLATNIIKKKLSVKYNSTSKTDTLETLVSHALGIIDVNGYDVPLEETEITGIYYLAAMMEHSCYPNTKYKYSSSHQITVKAVVDIHEGEHITNAYTKLLQGTVERRTDLLENKYFVCCCKRCIDPTEFGTNFSTLKCFECDHGYVLPSDTYDMNSNWSCTNCKCVISSSKAAYITKELAEQVEQMMINIEQDSLERLLAKTVDKKVHYNHFHLLRAKHTLMQLYGRGPLSLKDETLKKKEKLCQETIAICSVFDPGNSRVSPYTGVALYEYQDAVMVRAQKMANKEYPDQNKIDQCISVAKMLLQKCIKSLQDEADYLPEAKLRRVAQHKLSEICLLTSKNISPIK